MLPDNLWICAEYFVLFMLALDLLMNIVGINVLVNTKNICIFFHMYFTNIFLMIYYYCVVYNTYD